MSGTRQQFVTESSEATIALGGALAGEMKAPLVVLLTGNLGAGKTTLAKGIISGLGVAAEEEIVSPTFTLIHTYGKSLLVYHVDLYRIDNQREIETLGLEDLAAANAIVLIEWGEKAAHLFPGSRWEIYLEHKEGERRKIVLEKVGDRPVPAGFTNS